MGVALVLRTAQGAVLPMGEHKVSNASLNRTVPGRHSASFGLWGDHFAPPLGIFVAAYLEFLHFRTAHSYGLRSQQLIIETPARLRLGLFVVRLPILPPKRNAHNVLLSSQEPDEDAEPRQPAALRGVGNDVV